MKGDERPLEVAIKAEVIESLLTYSKCVHPKEGILILRGKGSKNKVTIESVLTPPAAHHDYDFSSFPIFMLPMDASIIGVAHSHPNGEGLPSVEDLNNFYGRVMVIVTYPYTSPKDIHVFSRAGKRVNFVVED